MHRKLFTSPPRITDRKIVLQYRSRFRRMIWREGFYTLSTAKLDRAFQREVALQLRLAEIQDAEAITALINAAFRLAESFLIDRDRIDLESVRGLLQKGQFLVADDSGALAGCVYVELRGDRAYLGLLAVDPDRQKAGLGSTLMNAAEDHCSTAACGFMDLQIVSVRQELPAFYRRRGYVETGTAPFPPGLDPKLPCHFVTMSKSLT